MSNNSSYMLGFICGLLIVLLVGIVLRIFARKKSCAEYDERQEAVRGTGFKYAYFTAMLVLIAGGIIEVMTDVSWCGLFTFGMLSLWISICVFTTYCVIKDAYFGLRARRKALIIIFLAASVINLCFGIESLASGELLQDGVLSLNAVNLLTGLSTLYLGLMLLGRTLYERRRGDAE